MKIAFVGSGGKTTLIHSRAREYLRQGKRVLVTTSTRMFSEADTIIGNDPGEIIRALEENHYAMAGTQHGEKIGPLSPECLREAGRHADVVLVEADGSRRMPLKFPAAYEPVICDDADEIIIVCGLHGLGMRAVDAVQRLELAKQFIDLQDDTIIEPHHIQQLLQKGYVVPLKEKYPDKPLRIHATQDVSLYQRAVASLLQADMDVSLIREEWFKPQPWLIICGGGHVSRALVQMASCLDFHIKVIDDRPEFADPERFPLADKVICDSFENLEKHMEPNACCVVVTREHKDDFLCVKTILKHSFFYLGMIGSRMKVAKTFERLRSDGVNDAQLSQIHAPIGLDIHAITPAEIAVSILAEIIAEKNQRHASSASRELLENREHGMLLIIIEKTGSSPRGVGSMMFVGRDRTIDSIGGGAVEFAAVEDARARPEAALRQYHLNDRDRQRLGMICGGSNKVLFIPI